MRFARAITIAMTVGAAGLVAAVSGCGRARTRHSDATAADAPRPLTGVSAQRGTSIALLYSSNLEGEYEHCGCPSHPIGGLVRRATFIDRARSEADGVLIVDAGDMLLPAVFHDQSKQAPAAEEVQRRARLILSAYARMGVQAVLPAERDLAIGPDRLRRLLVSLRVPAVASNLRDGGGRLLFAPDRLITVAGVSVGIFGVVQPQAADRPLWRRWGIEATDPTEAARREVGSLRARGAQMIVALLHLGPAGSASRLLGEVAGITWAVQGHAEQQLEIPETVGGARLVDAMGMGKLAGRLDIHVVNGGLSFSDKGERAQLLEIIADHNRQLSDLERRAAADKTDQLREYYVLRRRGIAAAIEKETELARKLPAVVPGSWYENRIVPLDESLPDHPGIALLVAAYNAENARRAAAGREVGIALRDPRAAVIAPPPPPVTSAAAGTAPASAGDPFATPASTYAGSAACSGCHAPAWAIFQGTKHARALAALAPSKRDRDPTCVGCHSTGYAASGDRWALREATTRLRDVGCESCHGPSLAHVTSPDKRGTTRRAVTQTVCRGCHTPDQTNGEFEYQTFRRAILGAGHGA